MARKTKLQQALEQILDEKQEVITEKEELENTINEAITNNDPDPETRQDIAKKFVKYYFSILILILIGVPIYNFLVVKYLVDTSITVPLKDIILTYSAVVGPTIGLVVAYYFKSSND